MNWLEVLSQFSPEAALVVTLAFLLLSDLFLGTNPRRLWTLALIGLGGASIAAIDLAVTSVKHGCGPLPESLSHTFACSGLIALIKAGLLLLALLSVAFSHRSLPDGNRDAAEYYMLLLFATLGATLTVSSQDLLMFFISFELLSLPLYILCGFRRYDSASAEAGLKYFINGALSSALLLYGISMIYGAVGSTHLPTIAEHCAALPGLSAALLLGSLLLLVGVGFKVSAAPFHNWAPDVYSGAPPVVSIFLATVPKVAMVAFGLRLFWTYLASQGVYFFHLQTDWALIFSILSVLSMFVGNLSALPQTDVRKIFAYSGVAQIGYIFMGLAACSSWNPHPERGISAVLFYSLVYALSNLGAWGVLTLAGRETRRYDLTSLRGLSQRQPLLGACLALCLMSLAGVPPLSGFVGKFYLFRAIYESQAPALVVFGILNSVISLFYYFKVLKAAYFVEPGEDGFPSALHPVQRLAVQVCLWSNLVIGLWPGLMQAVDRAAGTFSQGM